MKYTYAIGDIHGRDYLLEKIYERIIYDPHRPNSEEKPIVIHLGDYIDGGPESLAVLDRVMRGSPHFESIALLGNHEDLMLKCLETDDRNVWWNWISNGGGKTLSALKVSTHFGYNPKELSDALGKKRIEWLKARPIYYRSGVYLFIHAGVSPGVPLEEQDRDEMLWIRSRFLNSQLNHGYIVVHGHTQTKEPEALPNRIGIDTGAARPKTLTAVALDGINPPRFLGVS